MRQGRDLSTRNVAEKYVKDTPWIRDFALTYVVISEDRRYTYFLTFLKYANTPLARFRQCFGSTITVCGCDIFDQHLTTKRRLHLIVVRIYPLTDYWWCGYLSSHRSSVGGQQSSVMLASTVIWHAVRLLYKLRNVSTNLPTEQSAKYQNEKKGWYQG